MKCLAVLSLACLGLFLAGCTSSNSGTVTPIQAAGCDVESAILGGAAGAIASALSCTSTSAIQASLTTALGNANLCAAPGVAAISAASMKSAKSAAVKPQGVIGNLACPIAVNTIVGFLSNSVPSAWGCSASASASALAATLTSVCEAAVPL